MDDDRNTGEFGDEGDPLEALVGAANDFVWCCDHLMQRWAPLPAQMLPTNAYVVLVRSVVQRQRDALSAAALLIQHELGFPVLPLVRPAFEEYCWMEYLATVAASVRDVLLHESARFVMASLMVAQQTYA